MIQKERVYLSFINFSRNKFRNTWVHRIPLTSAVYKKVFSATYHGKEIDIVFRNSRYRVPTTDVTVVPSMISGDYEKGELDIFKKLLKEKDVVLDIGSNIGIYSIEAAKSIGKKGKIFAFEPVNENIKLLSHNLKINDVPNVNIIDAAVGATEKKLKLFLAENSIATHSAGKVSDNFIEVDVITIDNFVKKQKLKKIDMLKMDIEGYEGFAIEGGLQTIKKYQPILFIEFSSDHLKRCGYSPEKHAKNLLSLYKYCYHIDEQKKASRQLKSVKELTKLRNDNLVFSPRPLSL